MLNFHILAVPLRTIRFKIQKFYMVLVLRCKLCTRSENRQRIYFIHNSLNGSYNCGGKCLQRGTD